MPRIRQLLTDFPLISAVRVCEELRVDGYRGCISILRDRLRMLRPRPRREPVVRFETQPGEQGQMDWSPYTIDFTRTGRQIVHCFSYILGFCRRQYIAFTPHHRFPMLLRRHVDAFEYFHGVTRSILYDNDKAIVLRWEGGEPIFNPAFIAFITHYQCRPVACHPRRPQTKGKIERPFSYVEGNLLNGRRFIDMDDLIAAAIYWLANVSDPHIHETTGRPPLELFLEQEKGALMRPQEDDHAAETHDRENPRPPQAAEAPPNGEGAGLMSLDGAA
jgi:transposase